MNWKNVNFKNLCEKFKSIFLGQYFTLILLLLIIGEFSLLALSTSQAGARDPISVASATSFKNKDKFMLSSILFPDDISHKPQVFVNKPLIISPKQLPQPQEVKKLPAPSNTPKTSIIPKAIKPKVTTTPKPKISPTPKSSPIPTPKKEDIKYTEDVVSTVEGRDEDRILIVQLMADRISEYFFLYSEMPKLYRDKSKSELTNQPSNYIYFYNGDDNKVNALSLTFGADESSYLFFEVSSCDGNKSTENNVAFVYNENVISLCKESGEVEDVWIVE